ncbi:hypothetical protein Aperf_G00000011855 [Anoplocephala perfoliata]
MTFGYPITDNYSRFCFVIILLYTFYLIHDINTPYHGGRRSNWLRSLILCKWASQYISLRLIVSEELREWSKLNSQDIGESDESIQLPLSLNYLLGHHPHGAYNFGGNLAYGTEAANFSKIFPGIKLYISTLNITFYIPFFRDFYMPFGCVSVSRESLVSLLDKNATGKSGNMVAVAPGGVRETLEARPGRYVFILNQRRGFFRLALQTGSCLIPSIGFGETNLFDQVPNPKGSILRKLQDRMMRTFPLAITYSTHVIPYCRPVTVVAELTVAICDRPESARKLIKYRNAYPELKHIVLISPMGDLEHLQTDAGNDIEVISFDDLLVLGSTNLKPICPHGPDDTAIICYTSGTTGAPKGLMLTSKNFLAVMAGMEMVMGSVSPDSCIC